MDYYVIQDRDNPARRSTRRSAKSALNLIRNLHRQGAKKFIIRTGEGRRLKLKELTALAPKRKGRGR